MNLACLFDPLGCANAFVSSLPREYIFMAGMIVGAILGRIGTAAVIAIAGAIAYAAKRRTADEFHEHVGGKDAVKPVAKPKKKDTLFRRWGLEK